jgi:D-alanyl-D-alanine carboxypeptidase
MELHINHKGFTFNMFSLLEKYCNNASFNLALDLVINSKDLCFVVLLRHKHSIDTQAQMHKLCNTQQHKQDSTKHETKAQQTMDNLKP